MISRFVIGFTWFLVVLHRVQDQPIENTHCTSSTCGVNATCKGINGASICICLPKFSGNPNEGCHPMCSTNSDCPSNKVCQKRECLESCSHKCGQNAKCEVINHIASCACLKNYQGDPFVACHPIKK